MYATWGNFLWVYVAGPIDVLTVVEDIEEVTYVSTPAVHDLLAYAIFSLLTLCFTCMGHVGSTLWRQLSFFALSMACMLL